MAYHLSPALSRLRGEVNALWPNRDKTSDGWIGDAAHSARLSDHNPDADGSVNAIDIDKDGIDAWAVVRAAIADHRASYVIFAGTIWRRVNGWRPEAYTGTNPHDKHIHVSILHGDAYEDDTSSWDLIARVANPGSAPTIPIAPTLTLPAPLTPEDDMAEYLAHHTNGDQQAVYLVSPGVMYLLPPSPTYPDLAFHQARGLRMVEVTGPTGMGPIIRATQAADATLTAITATLAGMTTDVDESAIAAEVARLLPEYTVTISRRLSA